MKQRYRVVLYLFSLALLLFALYLNFIKKSGDTVFVSRPDLKTPSPATSAIKKADPELLPSKPSDGTLVLK